MIKYDCAACSNPIIPYAGISVEEWYETHGNYCKLCVKHKPTPKNGVRKWVRENIGEKDVVY